MKITFTKTVTLHMATVYMKIKKNVSRSDIQEYLNGKRYENHLVNDRINDYLKEIHIYDESNNLTRLGESVKGTGNLPTPEEGKYRIWYTQNDEYFENIIMFFQRENPNESNVNELDLQLNNDGHFCIPATRSYKDKEWKEKIDYTEFKLTNQYLYGLVSNRPEQVDVILIVEDKKPSYYSFSGMIWNKAIEFDNKPQRCNENIANIIIKALPDFDSKYNRLCIRFQPNFKDFEIRGYPCRWKGFEGRIDSVKLMPYDEEDAKSWRDYLLKEKLANHYLSPDDFTLSAEKINEKDAFEKYREHLDIPVPQSFKTEKNTPEFWHLNAPIDLNPNNLFTNINEIVELHKNDILSFSEIVSKLGIGSDNEIVIYYDKHVVDERKQKAAAALLDSINAKRKIIITDMSPQRLNSDYLLRERPDLRMRDLNSGIFSQKPLHNRYLIIATTSSLKFWDIGNSLDFIRFSDRNVACDTQGRIIQPITFTPISMIDKELLNFVNTEKNGN